MDFPQGACKLPGVKAKSSEKLTFYQVKSKTLAILMLLEENPYTVPHLKALNSGQKLWGGQRCGSTLSL